MTSLGNSASVRLLECEILQATDIYGNVNLDDVSTNSIELENTWKFYVDGSSNLILKNLPHDVISLTGNAITGELTILGDVSMSLDKLTDVSANINNTTKGAVFYYNKNDKKYKFSNNIQVDDDTRQLVCDVSFITIINDNQSIAIGQHDANLYTSNTNSISIGTQEGNQGQGSISIGYETGVSQGQNSTCIGTEAGHQNCEQNTLAIGYRAGYQDLSQSAVAIGDEASYSNASAFSLSVGGLAGRENAGFSSINIGNEAGRTDAGADSINIGYQAGLTRSGANCIKIGFQAGQTSAVNHSESKTIAIGYHAGKINQKSGSIAIGDEAGRDALGNKSVAIGWGTGAVNHGLDNVLIGTNAGSVVSPLVERPDYVVNIGYEAGKFDCSSNCVAIGTNAGRRDMGENGINIGFNAGYQNSGRNSILIGAYAGQNLYDRYNNAIVLNALGTTLNPDASNQCKIAPIRNVTNKGHILHYDIASKEVVYDNNINITGDICANIVRASAVDVYGDLDCVGLRVYEDNTYNTVKASLDTSGILTCEKANIGVTGLVCAGDISCNDISCNTLNYTTLNPPLPTKVYFGATNGSILIFPSSGTSTTPGGFLTTWTTASYWYSGNTSPLENGTFYVAPENGLYQVNATISIINGNDSMRFSRVRLYRYQGSIVNTEASSIIQSSNGDADDNRQVEHTFSLFVVLSTGNKLGFNCDTILQVAGDIAIMMTNTKWNIIKVD